ncbi:glutaredoxin 2 [Lonepinella koalarum]|uniref:glutaredoxin 2 n=1 Tax=Lonepinella koalarum TaxID=53417 RepID=UPI0011E4638F|nr:glutaredoxin 2 [Lonepinella koalarum]TYG33639.1 glutaredoxin 2 [Lonepinella koalarum]
MKLYVYDHCPYCVRARMIFGFKQLPVELVYIQNDDEATPVGLIGKKAVPILLKDDGSAMPESLDIVRYVDQHYGEKCLSDQVRPELETMIKQIGSYYNHLLLPRFVQLGLPEYKTQSALDYFVNKKSASIGDFTENLAQTEQYLARLQQDLPMLETLILAGDKANGQQLSIEDIMLFPMLRNLTCVKGVKFPAHIENYVNRMAKLTGIALYTDKAI